ncbi:MAG: hypothetical protein R3B45_02190 [Bdellovibrionota bacterium]
MRLQTSEIIPLDIPYIPASQFLADFPEDHFMLSGRIYVFEIVLSFTPVGFDELADIKIGDRKVKLTSEEPLKSKRLFTWLYWRIALSFSASTFARYIISELFRVNQTLIFDRQKRKIFLCGQKKSSDKFQINNSWIEKRKFYRK